MRFNRGDDSEKHANDIIAEYKKNLSEIKPVSIQELIFSRFNDPKTSVENYLDSFKERTGIKKYLNEVNEELNKQANSPDSLLDIPEIKESIDLALNSNQFDRTVDFLNKLQDVVSNDSRIPEDLKGVTMDAKLIDYIKSKIYDKESEINYSDSLKMQDVSNLNSDQKNMSYFDFDSSRKENERT